MGRCRPSARYNQVWTLDLARHTLRDGRPFRTLNVIDEGAREALRIEWLLFIQPGKPNQIASAERFNRSVRRKVLDTRLFNAVSEVKTAADDWITNSDFRPYDSQSG